MFRQPLKILLLLLCLLTISNQVAFSQDEEEELEYDQFTIKLNVDKLGIYEIEAVYYDDNIYLPLIDLCGKLEIFINHTSQLDTINGFILSNDNSFSLNTNSGKITFRDKEKILKPEQMISTFSDVYLPAKVYQEMFGMTMDFNFRELTVFLRSDIELPIIKQLRIKKIRSNLLSLTGEEPADSTIDRKWHFLRGAVIDWSLNSKIDNYGNNEQQFRSSVGVEFLGGELNYRSTLTRDSIIKFESSSIRWRYVNDKFLLVKQIEAGSVNVALSGQTQSNFYGLKLTNVPYTFKKTYGSYFIQRRTSPGWDVELYINGILVNFAVADMNGDFSFEIPLVFGNSVIVLRYYGPWGQENVEEIPINIPFSFTAQRKLQYQTFTGITGDSTRSVFNKTKFSYGLSRWATISAGYEYFDQNIWNKHIYSGSVNIALAKNLLLNYTYLHNSNHYVEFMYRSKRNLVLNGKHRQYVKNQTILQTNNRAESELIMNVPIWSKKFKVYLRNSTRAIFGLSSNTLISETALSFSYKRVNLGLSYIQSSQSIINLNTSIYLRKNWSVLHNSMYNISEGKPVSSNVQLQKRFNKKFFSNVNLAYNYQTQNYQIGFSLYFDFNFMRSSINTTVEKDYLVSSQSLAGSVNFTKSPTPLFFTNSNSVSRAGLDVLVFLDINHNEKMDENEPLIKNASVAINKGKLVLPENDSIHRFVSLEPYAPYLITVANDGFPNISWMLEKSTWSVVTSPNQIQKVFIPVKPMGEVEMTVMIEKNEKIVPAHRLIVYIMDSTNKQVARGLTEQDGYFAFLGLPPGTYSIKFDEKQLKGLGLANTYTKTTFEVKVSEQGDFVSGIEITLTK